MAQVFSSLIFGQLILCAPEGKDYITEIVLELFLGTIIPHRGCEGFPYPNFWQLGPLGELICGAVTQLLHLRNWKRINSVIVSDAAFLLTIGSFLLTVELFYLQLRILAFLLTIGAFFAYSFSFFTHSWSYGKVRRIRTLRDCKQRSLTVSKKAPTVSKKASPKSFGTDGRGQNLFFNYLGPFSVDLAPRRTNYSFGCGFFAYNWKLPADSGALLLTIENFSLFTYNWSFFCLQL